MIEDGRPTELIREAIRSLISEGAFSVGSLLAAVHFNALPGGERARDRTVPPCDQLEGTKQIVPLSLFFRRGCLPYTQSRYSRNRGNIHFQGTTFEFCCLPFGLSLANRDFTRILPPIVAKLRSEGTQTVNYLDDLLLIHYQKESLTEIFLYVRSLLSTLDFTVKLEKCSPAPTRRLVFLCAVLDNDSNVYCLARGTDYSDTGSLPGNEKDAVDITGPDRTVVGHSTLSSLATPAGPATSPIRMEAQLPESLSRPSLEDLTWWVSLTPHSRSGHHISPFDTHH